MGTQNSKLKTQNYRDGAILALVVACLVILATLGGGLLAIAYGVRMQAIRTKNEAVAMLAAEAGYQKAIFWMSQQQDVITALQEGVPGTSDSLQFADADCDYNIEFFTFIGSRPIYRIISEGHSGIFSRTVDVLVFQAISGWDMGMCRVPTSSSSTDPVNFVAGEIIDMPIHINKYDDNPDVSDIHIIGAPKFLRLVSMSESRYTSGGADKYSSIMGRFLGGIVFDQPDSKITDKDTLTAKADRFESITATGYKFTPAANPLVDNGLPAVQLEFYVGNDGKGYVRITKDCTVRSYLSSTSSWDYRIAPAGDGTTYEIYPIYGYHYIPEPSENKRYTTQIDDPSNAIYVSQSYGGVEGEPGAQIFVNGNVIIGSRGENSSMASQLNTVKGKISVVASGNIWITNELRVAGLHDSNGIPSADNPNVLGLIAHQGVIKIVDPGMTTNGLLDTPAETIGTDIYEPIANLDHSPHAPEYDRELPAQLVVEVALTIGGGGWGAENVYRGDKVHDRKNYNGTSYDELILIGTIVEAIRGVVGSEVAFVHKNGYKKYYYFDERLLEGILPGDIWLKGKYLPTPAGWHDYRPSN